MREAGRNDLNMGSGVRQCPRHCAAETVKAAFPDGVLNLRSQ